MLNCSIYWVRKYKFFSHREYLYGCWFDVDELNDILSTNGFTRVNKDEEIDQLEFDEENDENEVEDFN